MYCQSLLDQGQNNKFNQCFDMGSQSTPSSSQQQRSRRSNNQQRQQPGNAHEEYEFSTDEEAEFEYGVTGTELDDLDDELDAEDEEGDCEGDDESEDTYQGNPHQQHGQQQQPNFEQFAQQQQHRAAQMFTQAHTQPQTSFSFNLNGQPVPVQQGPPTQGAEGLQNLSQLANLANMLGNFGPNFNINFSSNIGGQPQFIQTTGSQGGTFFTQQVPHPGMHAHQHASFSGHGVGNTHYYVNNMNVEDGEDLLGEYPEDDFQDDDDEEEVDSDGEPLPSPEQIRDIINAIPSYRFEDQQQQLIAEGREKIGESKNKGGKGSDSFQDRQRADMKRKENDIICSICLERLKTGNQVKALSCCHIFHTSCINSWLKEKLQCPNCKKRVKL